MGRTILLGLLGVLCGPAAVFAQFAADRGATPPSGLVPAGPAPGTPPAAPAATGPVHPWAVKPEHGAWFICVKSYTGPEAKKSAEELTSEIRQTFKAACYVYEWGAVEREKEEQRRQFVREKLAEQHAPFIQVQAEMKRKADAAGLPFDPTPVKVRVPALDYPSQWGVLVGGFKDMETARKALDTVRTWTPPKATHLLDSATIVNPGEQGAGTKQTAFINPFATALVVPNPAIRRTDSEKAQPIDPALVKLNEQEDLSVLRTKKPWTLMVKGFTLQTKVQTKEMERSVMDRMFNSGSDAGEQLDSAAKQARELAKALRDPNFKPHPFEAYVLHIRNGSIVCVGQYDGPYDPQMIEVQKVLQWMTFEVRDKKDGPVKDVKKLFDNVYPMQVPRP